MVASTPFLLAQNLINPPLFQLSNPISTMNWWRDYKLILKTILWFGQSSDNTRVVGFCDAFWRIHLLYIRLRCLIVINYSRGTNTGTGRGSWVNVERAKFKVSIFKGFRVVVDKVWTKIVSHFQRECVSLTDRLRRHFQPNLRLQSKHISPDQICGDVCATYRTWGWW